MQINWDQCQFRLQFGFRLPEIDKNVKEKDAYKKKKKDY